AGDVRAIGEQGGGPEEEVEEVEAAGARLVRFVGVHRSEQLALKKRGEVGIGARGEVLELPAERSVGRDHLCAGDGVVVAIEALPRACELPAAGQIDQA